MPQAKNTPTPTEAPPHSPNGLQTAVVVFLMGAAGTVLGTALFGSDVQSERAFRVMHWWKRPAPEPAPEGPSSAPRGKRRS